MDNNEFLKKYYQHPDFVESSNKDSGKELTGKIGSKHMVEHYHFPYTKSIFLA